MTNYREFFRLQHLGMSQRAISIQCGSSRNTVSKALKRAAVLRLNYEEVKKISYNELMLLLFPRTEFVPIKRMPDFEKLSKELNKPGVHLNLL